MVKYGGKNGKLLAFGGYAWSQIYDEVEEWDPINEDWKVAPYKLDERRADFATVAIPSNMICPNNE